MEKIQEYMERTLTLKDLLKWMAGVITSLMVLGFTWAKSSEEKQNAMIQQNRTETIANTLNNQHQEAEIKNMKAFDASIAKKIADNNKAVIKNINDNHNETLKGFTALGILIERNSKN